MYIIMYTFNFVNTHVHYNVHFYFLHFLSQNVEFIKLYKIY